MHLVSGQDELVTFTGSNPVWSDDDKHIVYEKDGDVYRIRVNGSGRVLGQAEYLTASPETDGQPSAAPAAHTVAFHSNASGDFDIYVVEPGELPSAIAGKVDLGDYDPSWSPEGNALAYAGFTGTVADGDKTSASKRFENRKELKKVAESVELNAYPNPFNPTTMLQFSLTGRTDVRIEVFDMLGRRVAHLIDGKLEAGTHGIQFDASALPSGTYIYRLIAGSDVLTKSITLIR